MNNGRGSPETFDVCIIGSGASGGIAARVLTQGGLKVALLEAGGPLDIEKDYKQHLWPYEVPDRGMDIQGIGGGLMANGFYKIEGEPFIKASGTTFGWFRSRIVGGRTNHWGRGVARFSRSDFKSHSLTGVGDDWPLTYEELSPYYSQVEQYVGVIGPTSYFGPPASDMPAPSPKCYELLIKKACDKLCIPTCPTASAIITKPHNGRQPCHYCAQCPRGCKIGAGFSISQTAIPDAIGTGRLTLITNAMARELLTNGRGLIRGVSFIDKLTYTERQITARCVVVAASACESARLLLNSKSSLFPNGLSNGSGVVGRFLRDSVGTRVLAYFPALENYVRHNCNGIGRPHIMVPWWNPKSTPFAKGYEILFSGGQEMPLLGIFDRESDELEGYGLLLKRACRRRYGAYVHFIVNGEMLSNNESFCEVDPSVCDKWGIPVLRFHFTWGTEDRTMVQHMLSTVRSIIEMSGGIYLGPYSYLPDGITIPGENFRESGTVRMGDDPETSAVNSFCQSHEINNLFVIDASCFTTTPEKPPTLTIMALAWRAADYILGRARTGGCSYW
jgi:choline dehydrogenase-like flavoprotein